MTDSPSQDPSRLSSLASALERQAPGASPGGDSGLGPMRVPSLHAGPLGSFPQGPAALAGDVRASLLARVADPVCGLLVLSFEPEDALEILARRGGAPRTAAEALTRLGALGAEWLPALARGLGRELLDETPAVSEDTLVGAVLSAHPPPDTRVVSIELAWPDSELSAVLLWLTHEKALGAVATGPASA
ncbi:MAG: hypothetical protein QNK05_10395 [Myxococcota bacterium]|nr:hypothetical protein [Myxococcota bacterium]